MNAPAKERTEGCSVQPSLLPGSQGFEWDLPAEQAVLGGILLVAEVIEQVSGIVQPRDFFLPSHQKIFAAALSLKAEGVPVDPITVGDRVAADPDVGAEGGRSYLWTLPELSVPALNAPHHARIVKMLSDRRTAKEIARAVSEDRLDLAEAQRQFAELAAGQFADSLPTICALDFCREVPEEPDWLMEGYLARGAITELDAKIKIGKTHLACDLIRAVLAGDEFLGQRTTKTAVLYLTEERPATFRTALGRVGLESSPDLYLCFRHETRTRWGEMGHVAAARAKSLGVGLVVIDTLSDWSALGADEENDAGAALEAMRPLMAMAAAGLAVLVLRHERKSGGEVGDSARGSSAFGGAADILLALKRDGKQGHENRRVLEAVGRLEGWSPRLVLEMSDGHYRSLGTSAQIEADKARESLLGFLPTEQDEALTEKQLLEKAPEQISRSTLKRVLKELIDDGTVDRAKGAGSAPARAFGFWIKGGRG